MSQRMPDYEALRAAQARAQQADRVSHDEAGNESVCGETFDHAERMTYKDDDVEQWECERCGAEWYHDIEEDK